MEIKKNSLIKIVNKNKWMNGMLGFCEFCYNPELIRGLVLVRMFGRISGFDAKVYREEVVVIKGLYLKEESGTQENGQG